LDVGGRREAHHTNMVTERDRIDRCISLTLITSLFKKKKGLTAIEHHHLLLPIFSVYH